MPVRSEAGGKGQEVEGMGRRAVQETLVSPHVLQANSIPFNRIVQEPGEFIINFPGEREEPVCHLALLT